MPKMCNAEGCAFPVFGKGFCKNHQYLRTDKKTVNPRSAPAPRSDNSKAMLIADKAFSLYVRTIFSDSQGICNCITCGDPHPIKQIDCGHYKSRKNLATRYEIDNARPQCISCNRLNDGDEKTFRIALVQTIGEIRVAAVEYNSRVVTRMSEADFLEIAEECAAKTKNAKLLKVIEGH